MRIQWVLGIASILVVACSISLQADDVSGFDILQTGHPRGADCGCDSPEGKANEGDSGKDDGVKCGEGIGRRASLFCVGDVEPFQLLPEVSGIQVGGWTQVGYHSQNSSYDLFNTYEDHVALHQQWLYMEKKADGSCGWDWGFRFDAMYGIDGDNTQAFGNNWGRWDYGSSFQYGSYGIALPQAYVEVANGDLSIIAGHFYTSIGYEVVPAPDNFFYSHSFTMNNSEPFTHTGILATYGVNDRLKAYGGWTLGWDTGFDQFNSGNNILAGLSYSLTDRVDLTYMAAAANFGLLGREAYSHSIILDVAITDRLNYVFQSDLLDVDQTKLETIGINQYLIYNLNKCWGFGARVEWWKADGMSANAATFGVNWRPHTNLVLRPEIKQEWIPANNYDETIFGVDMVLTY